MSPYLFRVKKSLLSPRPGPGAYTPSNPDFVSPKSLDDTMGDTTGLGHKKSHGFCPRGCGLLKRREGNDGKFRFTLSCCSLPDGGVENPVPSRQYISPHYCNKHLKWWLVRTRFPCFYVFCLGLRVAVIVVVVVGTDVWKSGTTLVQIACKNLWFKGQI